MFDLPDSCGSQWNVKWPSTENTAKKSVGSKRLNCCRLCKSFDNVSHWKNLFGKGNWALLAAAENIHINPVLHVESLPHPLCRPCERRLNNFIAFKSMIIKTEKSYNTGERIKGYIEVLLSAPQTLKSSKAQDDRSSRQWLGFKQQVSLNYLSEYQPQQRWSFPHSPLTLRCVVVAILVLVCIISLFLLLLVGFLTVISHLFHRMCHTQSLIFMRKFIVLRF